MAFQLIPGVTSGAVTAQSLANQVGPGKLNYKNYLQLSHMVTQVQNEPDTKKALSVIYDSIPALPKTASPADQAERDNLMWGLYEQFQQGVGEKGLKGDDKTKYAIELVKPFVSKDIGDRLDKMLQTPSTMGTEAAEPWWKQRPIDIIRKQFGVQPPISTTPAAEPTRSKNVPADATWDPQANNGNGAWQAPRPQ
jgi:hypothetical protein